MVKPAFLKSLFGIPATCVLSAVAGPGLASDGEILRRLEKLTQRVEELEREVAVSRQETLRARSELARLKPLHVRSSDKTSNESTARSEKVVASFPVSTKAVPPSWTGGYLGFGLGVLSGQATSSGFGRELEGATFVTRTGPVAQSITTQSTDIQSVGRGSSGSRFGGELTIAAGYNIQLGRLFVSGLQIEGGIFALNLDQNLAENLAGSQFNGLTTVAASGTSTTTGQLLTATGQATSRLKHDPLWRGSALLRMGVLIHDNTLLYVAGGPTYFKFDTSLGESSGGSWAATIGGGIEARISPVWSITADYRYHRLTPTSFRATKSSSSVSGGGNFMVSTSSSSLSFIQTEGDMHSFRIGLNRLFN